MLVITVILVIIVLISCSSYILLLNRCLGYVHDVSLLLTNKKLIALSLS